MVRARNEALVALLREAGWSQPQAAAAVARVAAESGVRELEAISRSHIAMWVQGTQPSGQAPHILRETLSRRLGRRLTLADLGLEGEAIGQTDSGSDWSVDPLTMLAELGSDDLDMHRRKLLATATYSASRPRLAHCLVVGSCPRRGGEAAGGLPAAGDPGRHRRCPGPDHFLLRARPAARRSLRPLGPGKPPS